MRVQERIDLEKMEKLVDQIEKHPMTAEFEKKKAAKNLLKRKEAKARITALQPELEALPSAEEATAELTTELQILMEREKVLRQTINEKVMALRSERYQLENEKRQEEMILLETADGALDSAIEFFRNELDELRKPGKVSIDRRGGERNIFTETVTLKTETNEEAIKSRMAYCMAGIEELGRMKLEPEVDLQKIEAMKAGLPPTDIFQEYSGVHPLPGSKVVNPLHLLPSDSEMSWKLGNLNEKFQKWLRK